MPSEKAGRLRPVSEDLFRLLHFLIRAGEVESEFSGSASNVNLNGRQTAPLHSQVELFMRFVNPVMLETSHG